MGTYRIMVIPGDGVGPDVIAEALKVLDAAGRAVSGFALEFETAPAGAGAYLATGKALPDATVEGARAADAVLLGACGLPTVRYPDGTEMIPQVELRTILDLYAGIRPIRLLPGVRSALAGKSSGEIDFVIVRESTEGLFASRSGGVVLGEQVATDTQVITRAGTERVVRAAFEWCRARPRLRDDRPRKVTCVDKSNVLRSFAFFRRVFDEIAAEFPDVEVEHRYVDATAARFVSHPESLDVLVTENMFGDILSDLGAGLIGGMGMAPSGDIGDRHAIFQPSHGTAPDIAGKGIANPHAAILSAAMMLEWLSRRHGDPPLAEAARRIEAAVAAALAAGEALSPDLGGSCHTAEVGDAVAGRVTSGGSRQ
jgi:3-isopropylmalate dehydrogenase